METLSEVFCREYPFGISKFRHEMRHLEFVDQKDTVPSDARIIILRADLP